MQKNHLKALLLTATLTLQLSACGAKGPLYQTPKQPEPVTPVAEKASKQKALVPQEQK